MKDEHSHEWWQRGVIYQIYPWSFRDANGDGIGDLKGIESKLEYLCWLGVDAMWISPIFPSPMADFGYDVTEYCDVDPRFGTLADFDSLLASAHRLGLKLILDFVPNHTSDQHPWFVSARSSRSSPKRDFYIWRDAAADGGPPTNWLSEFGGPAWEFDAGTGQYYYHAYLKEQPDLNFRNPEVQRELLQAMRFWLDRGVDGFRVDTVHHLIKDELFRDNPPNPDFVLGMAPHRRLLRRYTTDRPELEEAVAMMRRVVDEYEHRVLIGEVYLPLDRLIAYYGRELRGLHLPLNFQLIRAEWRPAVVARIAREYDAALPRGAWPNWVLGNHDVPRLASRVGPEQARLACLLLLTLRGTPTLYYGDEIGMTNGVISAEQVRDPFEKNVPGLGLGRDPERTPMQWTAEPNAGFGTSTPWLPIAADAERTNVEAERGDPASMLSLYRATLELRRRSEALSIGSFAALDLEGEVLGFERRLGARVFTVLLNFAATPQRVALQFPTSARIVLSTVRGPSPGAVAMAGGLTLEPDEGLVIEV